MYSECNDVITHEYRDISRFLCNDDSRSPIEIAQVDYESPYIQSHAISFVPCALYFVHADTELCIGGDSKRARSMYEGKDRDWRVDQTVGKYGKKTIIKPLTFSLSNFSYVSSNRLFYVA